MMFAWLFAPAADRRLLGTTDIRGPTPWVIAIMSFSMMIIAASGLALAHGAGSLRHAIESRYAVEVPNGAGSLDPLVKTLRATAGVVSVEAVPEKDMRLTLEQWLGPAAQSADLPVPALVNFDVRPGTDIGVVQQRIRTIVPEAQVSAHRDRVAPLLASMRAMQWLAFGLVLMLGAAAAAAVVLAARGALDTHRFTIEVMHGIGATDVQLTELFQRKIAIDALVGSVAGAAAGAIVIVLLGSGASFAGELTGAGLGLADLSVLFLLPLALTLLATWVARVTVLAALRDTL